MPKIDLDTIEQTNTTGYPMPFAADMAGRWVRRLGSVFGLADFGISHVVLEPGGISSQRHWHEDEDEFVVVLEGEAVLVEDTGEVVLHPGDCAAFPKGITNGHQIINRSDRKCAFIAVGKPPRGFCGYSDIDMLWDGANQRYTHKDGRPYPTGAS